MRKKFSRIGITFIALLIIMSSMQLVAAIGITPGRTTIDFQPGLHKTVQFKVMNNEHKDMKLLLFVEGELNNSIALHEKLVDFTAADESKTFNYDIDLPTKLDKPGEHEVKIIAMELPKETAGGTYVGATAAVATQLIVRVPYPQKYAEISLSITQTGVKKPTSFFVAVNNLGQHDLIGISSTIEIFNSVNEKIATLKTDAADVPTMKRGELRAVWDTNVNPGMYKAVATLVYDDSIATTEKVFSIGSLTLDIVDINVRNFRLGDIAKFDITAENKWSEDVKDVFAQLQIFDEAGAAIANVKTASVDVPAMGRQVLVAYWDTAGIREGTYSGKLVLNFANQQIEKKLKTEIKLNSIRVEIVGASITAAAVSARGGNQNLIFLLILILIIINVAWFVYFKRREKKK